MNIAILILEDDEVQLMKIKTILRAEYPNATVQYASDGVDFLRLLMECQKREPISLIILDINVPKMNGIEVLKRLKLRCKTNYDGCTIPTVMFTTGVTAYDKERCLELGAKEVAFKPPIDLMASELRRFVRQYVIERSDDDGGNDTLTGILIDEEKPASHSDDGWGNVDDLLSGW